MIVEPLNEEIDSLRGLSWNATEAQFERFRRLGTQLKYVDRVRAWPFGHNSSFGSDQIGNGTGNMFDSDLSRAMTKQAFQVSNRFNQLLQDAFAKVSYSWRHLHGQFSCCTA